MDISSPCLSRWEDLTQAEPAVSEKGRILSRQVQPVSGDEKLDGGGPFGNMYRGGGRWAGGNHPAEIGEELGSDVTGGGGSEIRGGNRACGRLDRGPADPQCPSTQAHNPGWPMARLTLGEKTPVGPSLKNHLF